MLARYASSPLVRYAINRTSVRKVVSRRQSFLSTFKANPTQLNTIGIRKTRRLPVASIQPSVRATSQTQLGSFRLYTTYSQGYPGSEKLLWACLTISTVVYGLWQIFFYLNATVRERLLTGVVNIRDKRVITFGRFLDENFTLRARTWTERPWTLITSAFSHTHLVHYLLNSFAFYIFSGILVPSLSARRFGILILGSGLASSAAWLAHEKTNPRRTSNAGVLGMSGITQGVLATAACLYPRLPMSLFGLIRMPLAVLAGGVVAVDAFYLYSQRSPVAHAGHLGGSAFGVAYYLLRLRTGRRF